MTKMTRQHFRAFAEDIRRDTDFANQQLTGKDQKDALTLARQKAALVTRVCRRFNPAFREVELYRACGLPADD